jgi:hypothetical protein
VSVNERGKRYPNDRSSNGHLVHEARASGRHVEITSYLEAGETRIRSTILCRTPGQAEAIARALNEAPEDPDGQH